MSPPKGITSNLSSFKPNFKQEFLVAVLLVMVLNELLTSHFRANKVW